VHGDKVACCLIQHWSGLIFSLLPRLGLDLGRPSEHAFLLSRTKRPFTPSQWMELEHQALIYKYLNAKAPIPSSLLISISKSFRSSNRGARPEQKVYAYYELRKRIVINKMEEKCLLFLYSLVVLVLELHWNKHCLAKDFDSE
jgi:hypothetical protein